VVIPLNNDKLAAHGNVWKEILDMQDHISVKYEALEQLFCQKQIQKAKENEKNKVKPPSEVRLIKGMGNLTGFSENYLGNQASLFCSKNDIKISC
jgi:hypothetical protein